MVRDCFFFAIFLRHGMCHPKQSAMCTPQFLTNSDSVKVNTHVGHSHCDLVLSPAFGKQDNGVVVFRLSCGHVERHKKFVLHDLHVEVVELSWHAIVGKILVHCFAKSVTFIESHLVVEVVVLDDHLSCFVHT